MVTVRRSKDSLSHSGTKGMKWGYNDGQRNGRRTASELKKVQEMRDKLAKENGGSSGSGDIEKDYDEANNMLKYLGISLDLHSDDNAVARTMSVYETMRDSKDNYKSQYDWLNAFSNKLAAIGYDMSACDKYLTENKDALEAVKSGTGSGESSSDSTDKSASKKSKEETKETSDVTKSETAKTEKKETNTDSSTTTKSSSKNDGGKAMQERQKANAAKLKKNRVNDGGKAMQERQKANAAKLKSNKVQHSYAIIQNGDELYHHGILGQKWGVRRYQNLDGSLTSEGKKRYSVESSKYGVAKGKGNSAKKYTKKRASRMSNDELDEASNRLNKEANYKNASDRVHKGKSTVDKLQTAAIATTALVTVITNSDKIVKIGKKVVDTILK